MAAIAKTFKHPMILKLDIDDRGLKIYKVSINHSSGLTLAYFTAMSNLVKIAYCSDISRVFTGLFEPRCEKTGLRGFRPGPTQSGLYSHRRCLEA